LFAFRYVLPNHYLFQLAERPPADMAALLQMFQSVPPVVRRRAKELLEAIRACLQRHLTKAPEAAPAVEREDTEMELDAAPVVAAVEVPAAPGLWSLGIHLARFFCADPNCDAQLLMRLRVSPANPPCSARPWPRKCLQRR
jgi:hypothetical protein